jgi:hypothetical protein
MKGRTKWFKRYEPPVRNGEYECLVMVTSLAPLFIWNLQWDGIGFITPMPMVVKFWRGQTKKAAQK